VLKQFNNVFKYKFDFNSLALKYQITKVFCIVYIRHAQHTARGPNVARQSFQTGPQSPNLHTFGLIFDVNTI